MKLWKYIRSKECGAGFLGRGFVRPAAWVLLGAALSLTGCSKDPQFVPGESPDGKRGLTLTLVPQFAVEVDVKSSDVDGVNDISDLWVIQLNEAGTDRLTDPVYLRRSELPGSSGKILLEELKSVPSRIYAIANTHNMSLYLDVNSEADILAVQGTELTKSILTLNGAPMSGFVHLTSATHEVSIPLYRAVAKIVFKWKCTLPSGDSFTPDKIHLRQVPSTLNYFRDYDNLPDPAATPYPVLNSDPFVPEWTVEDISSVAPAAGSTFTWYMPENARGTGRATAAADKSLSTAPFKQEDYCTVAIVCGTYTSGTTTREVSYHFYLGGDNVKDYNLLRNREYNVSVTITGMSNADMRVICERDLSGWAYADWSYDNHGHNSSSRNLYTGRFLIAEADVDGSYTWENALTACPAGWRLPTLTELELIYCMRDTWDSGSNGFFTSSETVYWSVTLRNDVPCMVYFNSGVTGNSLRTQQYSVRCVRDV